MAATGDVGRPPERRPFQGPPDAGPRPLGQAAATPRRPDRGLVRRPAGRALPGRRDPARCARRGPATGAVYDVVARRASRPASRPGCTASVRRDALQLLDPEHALLVRDARAGPHAEALGYDGVWYADHFMPNAADPVEGPAQEMFAILAGLAAAVPRVRLGSLVAGNTYRHPAVLAKIAASIDQMSEGRLVLGLGAGWQENEHRAYGIEFNTFGWRFDRLEEACEILTSLFAEPRHVVHRQALHAGRRAARPQGRSRRRSAAADRRRRREADAAHRRPLRGGVERVGRAGPAGAEGRGAGPPLRDGGTGPGHDPAQRPRRCCSCPTTRPSWPGSGPRRIERPTIVGTAGRGAATSSAATGTPASTS